MTDICWQRLSFDNRKRNKFFTSIDARNALGFIGKESNYDVKRRGVNLSETNTLCTCNVTLKRLLEFSAVYNVCVCSLWYSSCNMQATYWDVVYQALQYFSHYFINDKLFENKNLLNTIRFLTICKIFV